MEWYKTVQVSVIPFGNLTQIHAIQFFLVVGMNIMPTDQAADDDERQHLLGADVGAPSIIDEAKQAQTPLFVELCAGCGILSATVAAEGFDVMAVDHSHNKHKTHVKMFNLDLSKEHSWGILRHIITECNVMGVHMAPPCGTCSRAREIRLNDDWHRPQPLRDYEHPYGVPWMSAKDAERVRTANGLVQTHGAILRISG